VVLGIELDTQAETARLLADLLFALQELTASWQFWRWCRRHQLESLIGQLHHLAKVVWLGRTFLWSTIDLLCCFRKRDHPIRLNTEFHLALQGWQEFLLSWQNKWFSGSWDPLQASHSIAYLFIYLYIYLFIYLFTYLFIYLTLFIHG